MVCWRGLTRVVCWEHPFFQSWNGCKWLYTMHGDGKQSSHTEPLRNCLWARVLCASMSRPWHNNTTARALRKDSRQKYPDIDVYPDIKCKISAPTSNHPALRDSTEPPRTWMKKIIIIIIGYTYPNMPLFCLKAKPWSKESFSLISDFEIEQFLPEHKHHHPVSH